MTVRQLKLLLARHRDEDQVVLQKDAEGNGFSPLDGVDDGFYDPRDDAFYNADDEDTPEECVRCVVLWPLD